jgi:hypothetical protein
MYIPGHFPSSSFKTTQHFGSSLRFRHQISNPISCIDYKKLISLVLGLTRVRTLCCRDSGWLLPSVYRQLQSEHWLRSEPLDHIAPVDRAAWALACETVHIYGETRGGARVVWTQLTPQVARKPGNHSGSCNVHHILTCVIVSATRYQSLGPHWYL